MTIHQTIETPLSSVQLPDNYELPEDYESDSASSSSSDDTSSGGVVARLKSPRASLNAALSAIPRALLRRAASEGTADKPNISSSSSSKAPQSLRQRAPSSPGLRGKQSDSPLSPFALSSLSSLKTTHTYKTIPAAKIPTTHIPANANGNEDYVPPAKSSLPSSSIAGVVAFDGAVASYLQTHHLPAAAAANTKGVNSRLEMMPYASTMKVTDPTSLQGETEHPSFERPSMAKKLSDDALPHRQIVEETIAQGAAPSRASYVTIDLQSFRNESAERRHRMSSESSLSISEFSDVSLDSAAGGKQHPADSDSESDADSLEDGMKGDDGMTKSRLAADEKGRQKDRFIDNMLYCILFVLAAISITLLVTSIVYTDNEIWRDWTTSVVWTVPIGIGMNLIVWTNSIFMRKWFLRHWNFTEDEIEHIMGPRHNWTRATVKYYQDKYGDKTCRIVDGVPRKLNHIITTLCNLLYVALFLSDLNRQGQTSVVLQSINLMFSAYIINRDSKFGWFAYGVNSRIRDGNFARKNVLLARVVSLATLMTIGSIWAFMDLGVSDDERSVIIIAIYIPTTFGDALGEIIGSVWGKHTFKVWGIGTVNKKSIEGCLAVFLGSLIPLFLLELLFDADVPVDYWYLLAFILSISATVFESISPRGTDNFVMPVTNLLIVWAFFSKYGSPKALEIAMGG